MLIYATNKSNVDLTEYLVKGQPVLLLKYSSDLRKAQVVKVTPAQVIVRETHDYKGNPVPDGTGSRWVLTIDKCRKELFTGQADYDLFCKEQIEAKIEYHRNQIKELKVELAEVNEKLKGPYPES